MMLRKLVVALALSLSHADNLRATRSRGRTLQEVNLVPEDEAADLKKQEEAQREKAMAEAAAAMEKAHFRPQKTSFCKKPLMHKKIAIEKNIFWD